MDKTRKLFGELVEIMAVLRGPQGCPWDKEQTHRSLKHYLIEEAYEAVEAIDREDFAHLQEELGDILLQIVFHAQLASEEKKFGISEILTELISKLKRRHPHIFGGTEATSAEEVRIRWEEIKKEEKGRDGALQGVSRALPALLYALSLQDRAARVGFDWPSTEGVTMKIREELDELETIERPGGETEEELGDIFFSLVNLCRRLRVDPELALRKTAEKFSQRFAYMENSASAEGKSLSEMSLEEKDKLWDEAKKV